jgi:hypothetical protein
MLKQPDLNPMKLMTICTNESRMQCILHKKCIKQFELLESSRDGDQQLTLFMREVENVVREIMENSRFKGQIVHQAAAGISNMNT